MNPAQVLTSRALLGMLALARPWRPAATVRSMRNFILVRSSDLFDREWYLDHNPDVAKSHLDPALHYLRFGASELRDPGPRFSTRAYLASNPDVAAMGMNPLVHFLRHGRTEHRQDRLDILRSLFRPDGRILEFGPLHNPVAPRREGYRVEIVDHLDADGLREKYAEHEGVDATLIEVVDHVWHGQPLHELVSGPYDAVIASHVFEHLPDPIGFLNGCLPLLSGDGVLVLAVPDHRRCFDALRPVSTVGQIKAANSEARARHPASAVFDHHFYAVALEGVISWTSDAHGSLQPVHSSAEAVDAYARASRDGDYIDVHAWVFNPESFRAIIEALWQDGSIGMRECAFSPGDGNEFYISLSPMGRGPGCSVLELLMAAVIAERDTTFTPS